MSASVESLKDNGFELPARLRGLQPTLIRQFFERALPDSINFGLGEPDLPTPQFMRNEAARVAVEEQNGYTSHPGFRLFEIRSQSSTLILIFREPVWLLRADRRRR